MDNKIQEFLRDYKIYIVKQRICSPPPITHWYQHYGPLLTLFSVFFMLNVISFFGNKAASRVVNTEMFHSFCMGFLQIMCRKT